MNLNKFTKAELISKIKTSKVDSTNQSLYIKITEILFLFKSIILKLTLITLIYKIFKKYTFMTKIFRFLIE
jgi:hypothetical protein